MDFGKIFPHRIWRDMCEAFQVEDLALMIRATRGRSIDPSTEQLIDRSNDRCRRIDRTMDIEGSIERTIERVHEQLVKNGTENNHGLLYLTLTVLILCKPNFNSCSTTI